jgi:KaiC/GvpD/RAD55 family RecA-like ATPase
MSPDLRMKTYVEGYDRILEGGIPLNHIVLLAGTPGTMKSTLSYYMLYHNVLDSDAVAVYVTLEQSRESLLRQMEKMGLETDPVKERLHVLDLSLIRRKLKELSAGGSWMQVFRGYLTNLRQTLKFQYVVIDSLDVLKTMAGSSQSRTDLFYLFEWLRELGCTVILISEASPEKLLDGTCDEGYLSDGIIILKMQVVRDVETQRRIRTVKMRETNHDPSYYSLLFNEGKFQVTKVISE